MRKKFFTLLVILLIFTVSSAFASNINIYRGTASFSISGGYALPAGSFADRNDGGPAIYFSCQYQPAEDFMGSFLGWRYFFLEGGFMFMSTPLSQSPASSMNWYTLDLGPVFYYPLFRFACPFIGASAGWHYSTLETDTTGENESNNGFMLRGKSGIIVPATSSLSFRLEGSYSYCHLKPDAFNSIGIMMGASYNFSGDYGNQVNTSEATVKIVHLNLKELYAIRYRQYNSQGIGTISIKNTGDRAVYNISVMVDLQGISSDSRSSEPVRSLEPGETCALFLPISISEKILSITEDGKSQLRLRVVYGSSSSKYHYTENAEIQVFSKNAITWDRTERFGSFIMPRDATVSSFSRRMLSGVDESRCKGMSRKIFTAMVLLDSMNAIGIGYVNDPRNAFRSSSPGNAAIDYVQLPAETLKKKAGDCDDLTALYASLLEAVGVSTAIATIPGHIFLLFNTDVIESSAHEISDDPGDYMIRGGTVWIPVEVTRLREGFYSAWKEGSSGRNRAGFACIDTFKAWEEFPPADNETEFSIDVPGSDKLMASINRDLENMKKDLLDGKVAQFKSRLASNPGDYRAWNELGILYARFNRLSEAEDCFKKSVSVLAKYAPAICNLGNIAMLKKDYAGAVNYYGRALEIDGNNTGIIINHARALYEIRNYELAASEYRKALSKNPGISARYGYLARTSDATITESRAAYIGERNELNAWAAN